MANPPTSAELQKIIAHWGTGQGVAAVYRLQLRHYPEILIAQLESQGPEGKNGWSVRSVPYRKTTRPTNHRGAKVPVWKGIREGENEGRPTSETGDQARRN
jgi:hypothetical protein